MKQTVNPARRTPFRLTWVAAAITLVLLVPAPALACAVCGMAGTGDNAWAYFAMTMVISMLPIGMIGGVAWVVYRRAAGGPAEDGTHTAEGRRLDERRSVPASRQG